MQSATKHSAWDRSNQCRRVLRKVFYRACNGLWIGSRNCYTRRISMHGRMAQLACAGVSLSKKLHSTADIYDTVRGSI